MQWETLRLSRKNTARALVVRFSGALEQGSAQNLANYALVALGKFQKTGIRTTRAVALTSADYNPASDTVTLRPRGLVAARTLQLTIAAAGILDAEGRPIEGNGQPGGSFVATLSNKGNTSAASAGPAG
jgi:hypothetical protein